MSGAARFERSLYNYGWGRWDEISAATGILFFKTDSMMRHIARAQGIWLCSPNPESTCDSSLESELKELSNDTKNVQIDKERQKLAIFGPCAIYC
jgi:hypothetical protein